MDSSFKEYVRKNQGRFVKDISRLVAQPSVSARNEGVEECAALVAEMIGEVGGKARTLRRKGSAPLVYGEVRSSRSEKTVLFYNHFDVQPEEPLDLWRSPPFKPEVRGGRLYGRGASDDKGELVARLKVVESYVNTHGEPPCNIKFCFEGEEETGSNGLGGYVAENPDLFECDAVLWEDGAVTLDGTPVVSLGVKGILYVEYALRMLKKDAHSAYAAILEAAPWKMVRLLSLLRDEGGRVLVPGWYDGVVDFTPGELELVREHPFDREFFEGTYGAKRFVGAQTPLELKKALESRPTANISGLWTGYEGPGEKTVLPAEVRCKMDFRLTMGQDPKKLYGNLRAYMDANGFGDVKTTVLDSEPAARVSPGDPWAKAAMNAGKMVYGKKSITELSGAGTSPFYVFRDRYQVPIVAIGISSPDAANHAPNENIRLDLLHKGMLWMAQTIENYVGA